MRTNNRIFGLAGLFLALVGVLCWMQQECCGDGGGPEEGAIPCGQLSAIHF